MNVRLKVFGILRRSFIGKRKLLRLFRLTASAFRTDVPPLRGKSYEECLREFRRFTAEESEKSFVRGDAGEVNKALFRNARGFGEGMRRSLRLKSAADVMAAARLLYGALGIDFRGRTGGGIVIEKCFFSQVYSPRTCELISALDRGIMAGLANGGDLRFTQRLTEGSACCLADFKFQVDEE
jgi:hypothetical protein